MKLWILADGNCIQNSKIVTSYHQHLQYKILRSHLICSIWKSADKKHPVELDVLSYGWEETKMVSWWQL